MFLCTVIIFKGQITLAKSLQLKINLTVSNIFLGSGIDTVYISSANADHYEQVIDSANAGKNILCEKPLAVNSTQTKEIIETCKKMK